MKNPTRRPQYTAQPSMRLDAFVLIAACALAARAATIPDVGAEKKLSVIPNEKNKASENVSSDQELIDQSNSINEVDNKLRGKPEDIPVQVIVENVEIGLKAAAVSAESEEVVRPPIDLKNPGPPQRQEHETQNPDGDTAEQQVVQVYKKNINDAQAILRQGFQGVSEGIQNLVDNNEQIRLIQQSIFNLQRAFISQINKLNGTVQSYIDGSNPAEPQIKDNFRKVESGLNSLRDDFAKGVKTLAEGVEVFSSLRSEEKEDEGAAPIANPAPQGPGNILLDYINRFQTSVQNGFNNLTTSLNNYVSQAQTQVGTIFNTGQPVHSPAPAEVQSDTPVAPAPAVPVQPFNPWQNIQNTFNNFINPTQTQNVQQVQQTGITGTAPGPITQAIQNIQTQIANLFQPNRPAAQSPQSVQVPEAVPPPKPEVIEDQPIAQAVPKPDEPVKPEEPILKPKEPVAQASQAAPVNSVGPIRQILQNNPISQGIAGAVQRLQNMNNPVKPRDPEKAVNPPADEEKVKGHSPNSSDSDNSGVALVPSEPPKEVLSETLPSVQEPQKVDQKKEETVDKTE